LFGIIIKCDVIYKVFLYFALKACIHTSIRFNQIC